MTSFGSRRDCGRRRRDRSPCGSRRARGSGAAGAVVTDGPGRRSAAARTLVLAAPGARAPELRAVLVGLEIAECIALVPEYACLARVDAEVRGVAVRRRIDADLRAAADELRRPFLELTATFARRYDSLAWWASGVAERNTNGSDLFLHCCYLSLAQ